MSLRFLPERPGMGLGSSHMVCDLCCALTPRQVHSVPRLTGRKGGLSAIFFIFIFYGDEKYIQFTILTIFKWHEVHSHWSATITTTHPELSSPYPGALSPMNTISHSSLPRAPGNLYSTFRLYELGCSRYLMQAESYNIWPFVFGLFHLA